MEVVKKILISGNNKFLKLKNILPSSINSNIIETTLYYTIQVMQFLESASFGETDFYHL